MQSTPSPSADLLGLGAAAVTNSVPATSSGSLLVDVFSDNSANPASLAPGSEDNFARHVINQCFHFFSSYSSQDLPNVVLLYFHEVTKLFVTLNVIDLFFQK